MAVVPDPHYQEPGNMQTGEAVTPIGTKYRMLFPAHAPFYTTSLVVKSGGKKLTLGDDYVITHAYVTGMARTGHVCHGGVWITNPKYQSGFTLDYHAIGIGEATAEMIAAEREANKDRYPVDCQWDNVIGDLYFPPVDIKFDWENWRGESELMEAIVAVGAKLGEAISRVDPIARNTLDLQYRAGVTLITSEQYATYDGTGGYTYNASRRRYSLSYQNTTFDAYSLAAKYRLPSIPPETTLNPGELIDWMLCYANGGTSILRLQLKQRAIYLTLTTAIGSGSSNYSYTLTTGLTDTELAGDIELSVVRREGNGVYDITVKTSKQTVNYSFNVDNPPSEFAPGYQKTDVAKWLKFKSGVNLNWWAGENDYVQIRSLPGAPAPDVNNDVYQLLVKYHQIVDKLYRDAPAHTHVPRKDNPHRDSWGAIRALENNGIASDATLVYGKTQPQLTDYVNNLLPKLSTLANKLLRLPAAAQSINGTFGMKPGLTSITSAVGTDESEGVGAQFTVDPRVIRFIGRDSQTVNAGNNPITWQGGANQLILYPDSRGLEFNGKKLLDPTTVGPYLPGNESGGDGLFYGTSTATVTINGNGIQSVPFICTFVPPESDDLGLMAVRLLATEFGDREDLAATPALIKKLDQQFTGKLVAVKSYINDMPLTSSIYIDKTNFGLSNVQNIPDVQLPISPLQQAELDKYAVVGHTHTPAALGIKRATTTEFGLVQFGTAVDDATLALDGGEVIRQADAITEIEKVAKTVDSGASINIIRYGLPGTDIIENGITYTDWMVTIKANDYFVGREYKVPLSTFNLAELFPATHEDAEFGVYVDAAGDDGKYIIYENPNTAETETMTKIGSIVTSETGVVFVEIRNVTRLGEFRELGEHIEDDNAHIRRGMTQAEFGFTYGTGGPVWSTGAPGTKRIDADWRYAQASSYTPMLKADYDPAADKWTFKTTSLSVTDYRFVHNTFPMFQNNGITATWTPLTATADSVLETVIGCCHHSATFMHRISVLVARTAGRITTPGGVSTYAGIAVNYGRAAQVVIGLNGVTGSGHDWTALNPSVRFSHTRTADGISFEGTINIDSKTINFELTLTATTKTLKYTLQSTGESWTEDLSTRLRPDYIDLTKLITDPSTPIYHGVGGLFSSDTEARLTYANLNSMPMKNRYYATFLDYAINYSGLNRARFFTGVVDAGSTINEMNSAMCNYSYSSFRPVDTGKIPPAAHPSKMMTFNPKNTSARTLIIRD
ncbi:virion structural protein [Salmonella phage SPLA1a]|nr:virion structural protein [Salmonella phage SPLA1a]